MRHNVVANWQLVVVETRLGASMCMCALSGFRFSRFEKKLDSEVAVQEKFEIGFVAMQCSAVQPTRQTLANARVSNALQWLLC